MLIYFADPINRMKQTTAITRYGWFWESDIHHKVDCKFGNSEKTLINTRNAKKLLNISNRTELVHPCGLSSSNDWKYSHGKQHLNLLCVIFICILDQER